MSDLLTLLSIAKDAEWQSATKGELATLAQAVNTHNFELAQLHRLLNQQQGQIDRVVAAQAAAVDTAYWLVLAAGVVVTLLVVGLVVALWQCRSLSLRLAASADRLGPETT